jgi:ComF family protein
MNLIDRALSLIAPHNCISCSTEGAILCRECADEKLTVLPAGICFLCGKLSANFKTCQKCATANTPQHVWAVCSYDNLAKRLVAAFKFEHAREAAKIMALYIDEALPYFAEEPLLVFVPTAPSHVRQRGFDHALLLAKELARVRSWHYSPLLVRQSNRQQHGATKIARREQIKGVFRVKDMQRIKGAHVLLLDDVVTTGSTVVECTKVLKKSGAASVDAVVFARTPEKNQQ